jgi:hypothetical protein
MNTNFILQCPDVGVNRVRIIKERIYRWLTAPALIALTKSFDGTPPDTNDLNALGQWYLNFSERWDFRKQQQAAFDNKVGEGARWLLNSDSIGESQLRLISDATAALGLTGNSEPLRDEYDYALVLGGAKLSNLLRSRLAKVAIGKLKKNPIGVVLLGSARPIGDGEREATNTYAVNANTEFDLFLSAARAEFKIRETYTEDKYEDAANPNNNWIVREYELASEGAAYKVIILAAPSSDPEKRRANSADTYEFFLKKYGVSRGAKLLLATSQIYVPYQHMEAVRSIALPNDVILDTIGFPPEWGGILQGMNEPTNYLQETRSTIQSISRFMNAY